MFTKRVHTAMRLRRTLIVSLPASALIVLLLFPMTCLTSPVAVAGDEQIEARNSNSWQDFLWEQQGQKRYKKDTGNDASENANDKASISTAPIPSQDGDTGTVQSGTTEGSQPSKLILLKEKDDDKVELKYFCKPDTDTCPTLKRYHMYALEPEDDFYPSWTYHGFHSPVDWHTVPIKYFEEPPLKIVNESENLDIRKHGSAMHLCTDEVTDDVQKCMEVMENECANSFPSPINIIKKQAKEDSNLQDIEFINYNVYFGFEMFFETDGSQLLFVKLIPHGKDKRRPGIRNGPLKPGIELFLDRILFRTGWEYQHGSEHSIDGIFFGMEIQFFFTADNLPYWQILSRYKTLPKDDPSIGQQLHVLSLFVKIADNSRQPSDGSKFTGNSMETLSLAAQMFWQNENENYSSTVHVEKKVLNMEEIFGGYSPGIYYTYQGSLSHPPCIAPVGWSVFEKPVWIKHHQWRRFAYAHAEYSDYRVLAGNIRPQNHILIKVNIERFIEMKYVQRYGDLLQTELDEAAENAPRQLVVPSRDNDTNATNTTPRPPQPIDMFLIRKYVEYEKYYARQVRKSVRSSHQNPREYDYNDVKSQGSTLTDIHGNHHHSSFPTLLVALWMYTIFV